MKDEVSDFKVHIEHQVNEVVNKISVDTVEIRTVRVPTSRRQKETIEDRASCYFMVELINKSVELFR